MSEHSTFLVVGCGAVGILYTYILSRTVPEANIFAVCRSNRQHAQKHGFRLNSAKFGSGHTVRPVIIGSIAEAVQENDGKKFDYIFISTKCVPPFSAMPEAIKPAVADKNTVIALFQNGIGIEDPYAIAYPLNPIISVAIYIKATELSTAVVDHTNIEFLHMGTFPARVPAFHKKALAELQSILTAGGSTVHTHDDVQKERWKKAVLNCAWNPVGALSRLADAPFLALEPHAADVMRSTMRETVSVANACGYDVGDELVENLIRIPLSSKLPGMKYSMLFDAVAEKPMEVDAVIGNIVKAGLERGVKIPLLTMLHLLVKGLDESPKYKG